MKHFLSLIIITSFTLVFGQEKYTISGTITDTETGEEMIGATVQVKETKEVTATNLEGYFSLTVSQGNYTLVIKSFGYDDYELTLNVTKDVKIAPKLSSITNILNEVVISGEKQDKNVTKNEMSVFELSSEKIEKAPQVFGEVDVIRTIQLLPGVSTVGEGASGFNVRGGNVDQNLVLLDEAPIYNSSHFFGLFSTFNNDVVDDLKLYKGGIPATYGGRLSSVLDVNQKVGDYQKHHGKVGVGIISGRASLEGPLIKDKASFIASYRRTWADIFFPLVDDLRDTKVFFYDSNIKLSFKLNENNKLYLSGYYGRDKFSFGDQFGFNWGNGLASVKWIHRFSDRLSLDQSVVYSNYSYGLGIPVGSFAFDWKAGITTWINKTDFNCYLNDENTLHFGLQANNYTFNPGEISKASPESQATESKADKLFALEPSIYVSHEWKPNDKLSIHYGLRYNQFYKFGIDTVFKYQDGVPMDAGDPSNPTDNGTIIDTSFYGKREISNQYNSLKYGLAPRLGITYLLNDRSSIKASYNRMFQYIHLISNTTAVTPVDLWRPSDTHIKPAISDQIAIGYFRNFKENTFETSIEAYYKWSQNIVDYKAGADLFIENGLEAELLSGRGRAYGLEFMVSKNKGKLSGWVAYTLSWTQLQIKQSDFVEEQINEGKWFAANYDKRHDITITASYALSKHWELGSNLSIASGRPYNSPTGVYEFRGNTVGNFSERNNARIPTYHRLDLSATHEFPKKKAERKRESSLVISVYNVYARKNIYSVYFVTDEENNSELSANSFSVFGSMIPSVTYNMKF